jgi:DNA-binding NtrC family response regulator
MLGDQTEAGHFSRSAKKSPAVSVLVVDDEPLIRWSLTEALGECGYRVVESGDAHGTRTTVHSTPDGFDVIVLDFRLPDSKDLTLLASLRECTPRSQVILMTAHGAPDIVAGALELGAFRVVSKPFELREMMRLVAEAGAAAVHAA